MGAKTKMTHHAKYEPPLQGRNELCAMNFLPHKIGIKGAGGVFFVM